MNAFSLRAPIVPQLKSILKDYPAGQVLSEGLQNAEDIGAKRFSFLLDLRHHDTDDLSEDMHRFAGPAFVLADDGGGFAERDWKSLQNLHDSEKQDSPSEIGNFGMGTRSYFHYSDAIFVASKHTDENQHSYVGLDPMEIASSGGWKLDMAAREARMMGVKLLDLPEIGFDMSDKGASGSLFRLPLRKKEHAEGGFGREVPEEKAREMVADFAAQLAGGECLLFLSSVTRVELWQWEHGAVAPVLVEMVDKHVVSGSLSRRLPDWMGEQAKASYEAMAGVLQAMIESERKAHSEREESVVELVSLRGARRRWLVVQRFDTGWKATEMVGNCRAVPLLGLAVPLEGVARGRVFCSLPIGDLSTGLPVHLNGCFHVKKDRRALWVSERGASSLGLVGDQVAWAQWNSWLMEEALPELWAEVLEAMTLRSPEAGEAAAQLALGRLPDLNQAAEAWLQCAEQLYRRIAHRPVLPHSSCQQGARRWVAPQQARQVATPTKAFAVQRPQLMAVYSACAALGTSGVVHWVSLPEHVQRACMRLSGLEQVEVEAVLRVLAAAPDVHLPSLVPSLLALAAYCADSDDSERHREWREALRGKRCWPALPVGGSVREESVSHDGEDSSVGSEDDGSEESGEETSEDCSLEAAERAEQKGELAEMFVPELAKLAAFEVYRRSQLDLRAPGVEDDDKRRMCRVLVQWGLKSDLTWADCEAEARVVEASASVPAGTELVRYIEVEQLLIDRQSRSGEKDRGWAQLAQIRFVPSEPPKSWGQRRSLAPVLQAPSRLLPCSDRRSIWAVEGTACSEWRALPFRDLDGAAVVRQIAFLAKTWAEPDEGSQERAELLEHLREASSALDGMVPDKALLEPLASVAWVPGKLGCRVELLQAASVAVKASRDLSPVLGLLPDSWSDDFGKTLFRAAGVFQRFPPAVLVQQVEEISVLSPAPLRQSVSVCLVGELASVLGAGAVCPCGVLVPTASGRLCPAKEVFINDAEWVKDLEQGCGELELADARIAHADARRVGCSSVREELARRCEEESGAEEGAFGQSEELATRIEGLLREYNEPSDIVNEHIQNCDDAGAQVVSIILDARHHPTEQLVNVDRAKQLQRPALLLGSSKALSAEDIARIQKLGASEKRASFAKSGRFGVGINSFYLLSDTPQLLANGALHVFDPLRAAVAREPKKPSRLRQAATTVEAAQRMLDQVCEQAEELLFAKSVRTLRVVEVGAFGVQKQLLILQRRDAPASPPCTADGVNTSGLELTAGLPESLSAVEALKDSPIESVSRVTLQRTWTARDAFSATKDGRSDWLVSHSLSADSRTLALLRKQLDEGTAMLPHGAVALRTATTIPLGTPPPSCVCCYLPLRSLPLAARTAGGHTLPLLLHGCFALDPSRRHLPLPRNASEVAATATHKSTGLFGSMSGAEAASRLGARKGAAEGQWSGEWNKALLQDAVASSLCNLVLHRKGSVANAAGLSAWFELLELGASTAESAAAPILAIVRRALLDVLLCRNAAFLPVATSLASSPQCQVRSWMAMGSAATLRGALRNTQLEEVLVSQGMDLVHLPCSLEHALESAASSAGRPQLQRLTPVALCQFLRKEGVQTSDPRHCEALLSFALPAPRATSAGGLGHSPDCGLDLSLLIGVELLLVGGNSSGSDTAHKTAFGTRTFFWDRHVLLPMRPKSFVSPSTREVLERAYRNKQDLLAACSSLKLRELEPRDLLQHSDEIHEQCLKLDGFGHCAWLNHFWQLVAPLSYERSGRWQDFAESFRDWTVLQVQHKRERAALVRLKQAKSTFSLAGVDAAWVKDLKDVLFHYGIPVLHPASHYGASGLLGMLGVKSGDSELLALLHGIDSEHSTLSAHGRCMLLRYWATRYAVEDHVPALKSLPLFQTHDGSLVSLQKPHTRFVTLEANTQLEHARFKHVLQLAVPGFMFLTPPEEELHCLYKRLGVCRLTVSAFLEAACESLPRMAAGGSSAMEPFLKELWHWTTAAGVRAAAAKVRFVATREAPPRMVAPKDLICPCTAFSKAFGHVLGHLLPAAEYDAHAKLLSALGMRSEPPAAALLLCGRDLDEKANAVPLEEKVCRAAAAFAETLCVALDKGWKAAEGSCDVTCLEQAAQLRVLLVEDCRPTSATHQHTWVHARARASDPTSAAAAPAPLSLRLVPFKDVVAAELRGAAWAALPVIAHHWYLSSTAANSTKLSQLAPQHTARLREWRVYLAASEVPVSTLTEQLQRLSAAARTLATPSRFPRSSRLARDFEQIFAALAFPRAPPPELAATLAPFAFGQPASRAPGGCAGAAPTNGGFGASSTWGAQGAGEGGVAGIGQPNTGVAPYAPSKGPDTRGVSSSGELATFMSITHMPQYASHSFEELRAGDHAMGRTAKQPRAPAASPFFCSPIAQTVAIAGGFGQAATRQFSQSFGSASPSFGATGATFVFGSPAAATIPAATPSAWQAGSSGFTFHAPGLPSFSFSCSTIPCIPKQHPATDNGEPELVELIRPDRTFEALPPLAHGQTFFHEISLPPETGRILRVQGTPQLRDWERLTHVVHEHVQHRRCLWKKTQSGASRDSLPVVLLETEIHAIEVAAQGIVAALRAIEEGDDGGRGGRRAPEQMGKRGGTLDVFLIDTERQLRSARTLVWKDEQKLRRRCEQLREEQGLALLKEGLLPPADAALLCHHSPLRPLTQCVAETIEDAEAVPATEGEERCRALVQAEAFARGLCAVSGEEGVRLPTLLKALRSVRWRWARGVLTRLVLADGAVLGGSEREWFAYGDTASGELWVQGGQLEGGAEREVLRELQQALQRLLTTMGVPVAPDSVHTLTMLECWRAGPSAIERTLGDQLDLSDDKWGPRPGLRVPDALARRLRLRVRHPFDEGALVALEEGEEEEPSFVFGRVCSASAPADDVPAGGVQRYWVDVCSVEPLHVCQLDMLVPPRADEEAPGEEEAEWEETLHVLKAMEKMDAVLYKRVSRRLAWLSCAGLRSVPGALASIVSRHREAFGGDKEYTWLDDPALLHALRAESLASRGLGVPDGSAGAVGPAAAAPQAAQSPGSGDKQPVDLPSPCDLFSAAQDVAAEKEGLAPNGLSDAASRELLELHADASTRGHLEPSSGHGGSRRARSLSPSRTSGECAWEWPDPRQAVRYWEHANEHVECADIMVDKAKPRKAVWFAQQAVECALKAALLASGALDDQGRSSHRAEQVMARAETNRRKWPVPERQLAILSDAYISARYPAPSACSFSRHEAEEALEAARRVLAWAAAQADVLRDAELHAWDML